MSSRDVWGFKLFNGFEIVGELESTNEHYVKIKNAVGLVLIPNPDDKNNPFLKFAPFSGFQDLSNSQHVGIDLELAKSNILAQYRVIPNIAQEYCEATGSIVIASSI